jgi:hypothetical protein
MHVVVAVTPAHPARRNLSKRRNQSATWFQLATVRLSRFFFGILKSSALFRRAIQRLTTLTDTLTAEEAENLITTA